MSIENAKQHRCYRVLIEQNVRIVPLQRVQDWILAGSSHLVVYLDHCLSVPGTHHTLIDVVEGLRPLSIGIVLVGVSLEFHIIHDTWLAK